MKRTMQWIVLFLVLSLLLVGCNHTHANSPQENGQSTTEALVTTEPVAEGLAIVKDGVANYNVVRGDRASQSAIDAALQVRKMISEATDVEPGITTDWVKKGSERDHGSLEILVGTTDYSESTEAMADVAYGDYVIAKVGNKIVINSWGEDSLTAACIEFRKLVRENTKDGNLILPADLHVTGTGNKLINQLPIFEGGTISTIYDTGGDTQLVIFTETTSDAYSAYMKQLASSGYTLYAENEIIDNFFATYINDDYVINAGYYAYENATRVTIEPRTALPPRETDNSYENKVHPSVAQFGLEFPNSEGTNTNNGQSHIFQLSDGSYIVVDGGFSRDRDAKALYDYMYANAPDPNNITIAAWILTHGHSDHTGAYEKFTKTYASKVKLELLIGNFPSDAAQTEGGIPSEAPSGDRIPSSAASYKGSKFIKAHVGQEFYLRDAKVEILYTLESFAPGVLSYYNTSSLIFTIKLAGQTILMLGDASNDACSIATKMYGEYLQADFIQVAHHGFGTGSTSYSGVTSVYTVSAAPVVLWPVSEASYARMNTRAYSAHLQELDSTKEIFVAGSRDIRLMLPYTVGTSSYESILK